MLTLSIMALLIFTRFVSVSTHVHSLRGTSFFASQLLQEILITEVT